MRKVEFGSKTDAVMERWLDNIACLELVQYDFKYEHDTETGDTNCEHTFEIRIDRETNELFIIEKFELEHDEDYRDTELTLEERRRFEHGMDTFFETSDDEDIPTECEVHFCYLEVKKFEDRNRALIRLSKCK